MQRKHFFASTITNSKPKTKDMRKHYMIDGMGKSCKMCVEFSWRGNSHGFAIRYALNIKHRRQSGKEIERGK